MTDKKDEVLKLALEALELEDMACRYEKDPTPEHIAKAITAIHEALAEQPAQQQDLPDFIAGAFGVSRGTAYDMMREALAEQPAPVAKPHEQQSAERGEPVAWPADMLERIDAAIQRITSGQGCMRVPPDKTDPDLVLAEIRKLIKSSPPASKPWVGLTSEERKRAIQFNNAHEALAVVIEAKLKEKNA